MRNPERYISRATPACGLLGPRHDFIAPGGGQRGPGPSHPSSYRSGSGQLEGHGQSADYFVVQAAAGSTHLVVKLAGPLSSEPVSAAASAAHRLANRVTKVPMSRLLAVDDLMSTVPYRYTVQTKVDGEQ